MFIDKVDEGQLGEEFKLEIFNQIKSCFKNIIRYLHALECITRQRVVLVADILPVIL